MMLKIVKRGLGALFCFILCMVILLSATASGDAAEKPWWPFPVVEFSQGKAKVVEYVPLDKASKKWNIVVLLLCLVVLALLNLIMVTVT